MFIFLVSLKPINHQECVIDLFKQVDTSMLKKYVLRIDKDDEGVYFDIDSINYNVIRSNENGKSIYERIENKINGIVYYKGYDNHGFLNEEGFYSDYTSIGQWNYKSSVGIDSIVDYDIKYKVSFCDFLKLCKSKNKFRKYSRINFDKQLNSWEISNIVAISSKKKDSIPNVFQTKVLLDSIMTLQVDSMKIRYSVK